MSTICEKPKSQVELIECHVNEMLEHQDELDLIGDNPIFGKDRPIPENDLFKDNAKTYDSKLGTYNSRKPDYFEMESIRRRLKDLLDFIDPLPINTYYLTDAKRCIVLTKKENGLEIDTSLYYKKEEEE